MPKHWALKSWGLTSCQNTAGLSQWDGERCLPLKDKLSSDAFWTLIWFWSRYSSRECPSEPWKTEDALVSVNIQMYASGVKKFLWVAALSLKCLEMAVEMRVERKNHKTHIFPWIANTALLLASSLYIIWLKVQVNIMWNLKYDVNEPIYKT